MKPIPLRFVLATLFASSPIAALATAQSEELQPTVRILAGDQPIDVTTGHAAPYVLDFDGDGTSGSRGATARASGSTAGAASNAIRWRTLSAARPRRARRSSTARGAGRIR